MLLNSFVFLAFSWILFPNTIYLQLFKFSLVLPRTWAPCTLGGCARQSHCTLGAALPNLCTWGLRTQTTAMASLLEITNEYSPENWFGLSQTSTTRVSFKLGFPWGSVAPQTSHIPGGCALQIPRTLGAAPLKRFVHWGLRLQTSARRGCSPKPVQWLRSLMAICHPLIFIGNYL